MATRNVYLVDKNNQVRRIPVQFTWQHGNTFKQSMKLNSLTIRNNFQSKYGVKPIEISSLSKDPYGKQASAMNMHIKTSHGIYTLERLFQAGKDYQKHHSMQQFINVNPVELKHINKRLIQSHDKLKDFKLFGHTFSLKPRTYFYDYTYMYGMKQHQDLANHIKNHSAFLDTWAKPTYTINTQAKSCAVYTSLNRKYGAQGFNNIIHNKPQFKQIEAKIDSQETLDGITTKHSMDRNKRPQKQFSNKIKQNKSKIENSDEQLSFNLGSDNHPAKNVKLKYNREKNNFER